MLGWPVPRPCLEHDKVLLHILFLKEPKALYGHALNLACSDAVAKP